MSFYFRGCLQNRFYFDLFYHIMLVQKDLLLYYPKGFCYFRSENPMSANIITIFTQDASKDNPNEYRTIY